MKNQGDEPVITRVGLFLWLLLSRHTARKPSKVKNESEKKTGRLDFSSSPLSVLLN